MSRANGWTGVLTAVLSTAAWATPSLGSVSQSVTGTLEVAPQFVPLVVDVSVDPEGGASTIDGAALISGALWCSKPAQAYIYGQVSQKSGSTVTVAYFWTDFICNGFTPWSVTAIPSERPFVKGLARVQVTGNAYDTSTNEYASDETQAIVRLRYVNALHSSEAPLVSTEKGETLLGEAL